MNPCFFILSGTKIIATGLEYNSINLCGSPVKQKENGEQGFSWKNVTTRSNFRDFYPIPENEELL